MPDHPDDGGDAVTSMSPSGARGLSVAALAPILDGVPAMVALLDRSGRYLFVNRAYAAFSGRPPERIIGRRIDEVIGATAYAQVRTYGARALAGEAVRTEGWVDYGGRGRRYLRRVYTPLLTTEGEITAYIAFLLDETERHSAAQALTTSQALKSAVIDGALDGIIGIDAAGTIVEFNPACERMIGCPRAWAVGHKIAELFGLGGAAPGIDTGLASCLSGDLAPLVGARREVSAARADGTRFPVELSVTVVRINGRPLYTAYLRDISERSRFERELAMLAYRDAATGLPNRLQLLRDLETAIADERAFALVIFDIDRFSNIQNSFGREFATEVLIGIAEGLSAATEPGDQLARVGDRAFALVINGPTDRGRLGARLEAISAMMRTAATRSGASVFLTASVGVVAAVAGVPVTSDAAAAESGPVSDPPALASLPAPAVLAEDVLRDAEIATSRARDAGGDRQVWFDPAMHDRLINRVRTEHDLRRALERDDQLWVAYQPIVEMVTGRLAGFEALVRWRHPERGQISPGAFVPIAEETGLIVTLGRWVLGEACRQICRWQVEREPGSAPLFMSVNLSPLELDETDCFDRVTAVIRETNADPSWLKMEITESAVMRKPEESLVVLRKLKGLGIRLSIDDFGTGHSSLSYLTKFPLDSIKVDRSFVSVMHQSEENRSMVRMIVDLARLLGFDVIAEGIETEADANLLRALACDYGQGYHYARPMPAAAACDLVRGVLPWQPPATTRDDDEA